ncbi:MAG: SGNH/GDSL hydrolase family protein [Proteobacteria bacterium]|nr:SGNH/GDSL hydrolase family protein [Pseudomonadota bacterium]
MRCLAFSSFFDGSNFGLADDLDAAFFVPEAAVDPDPSVFRVVILGSSTAVGTGASSPDTSWVGLLDEWLSTVTSRHEGVNLALGGATTVPFRPDGSSPLPDANRNITRASELHPDLIIANFPSNNVSSNIPVATTIAHYREMQGGGQLGIPFFLTTSQPRNFGATSKRLLLQTEANAVRAEFAPFVIDIYDELTDFNNGLRIKAAYDSGDGTHLNDAGHAYIFGDGTRRHRKLRDAVAGTGATLTLAWNRVAGTAPPSGRPQRRPA